MTKTMPATRWMELPEWIKAIYTRYIRAGRLCLILTP